jgi:uncharacterized protein YdbL (DUF1318 family)
MGRRQGRQRVEDLLRRFTRITLACLAASLVGVGAASAQMGDLDSGEIPTSETQKVEAKARVDRAKADGVVGEQWDGYLGLVHGNAEQDVQAAVQVVNWGRLQVYEQAAARNRVTAQVAGVAAFKAFIEAKIPPGEIYRNDQGTWVVKPDPAAAGKKDKKK